MKIKIILFHGLYSEGDDLAKLAQRLKVEVEKDKKHKVFVAEHDYPRLNASMGYFKWSRDIVRDYMLKCMQLEHAKDPDMYTIVLTHSNATWGVSRMIGKYHGRIIIDQLKSNIDLMRIDRLVLFGSTVKRDFDWGRYPIRKVINFVGTKDRVVWLSKLFKMGWSGRNGFKIRSFNLVQVFRPWRHSDFVLESNFDLIKDKVFDCIWERAK